MSNRPNKSHRPSASVQRARSSTGGSNRFWWIIGGVVVVVGLVAIIALSVGRTDSVSGGGQSASGGTVVPSGNTNTAPVTVTGDPLPQPPTDGSTDPAIGMPAPGLSGVSFDDNPVTITNDGQPHVVMFVAHWCPHCQREVPQLVTWLEQNGLPTDVELYAVATATSSQKANYPPGDWLRKEKWPVTTMVDDDQGTAAQAYGLPGFPYFVAVGADGNVVARTSGEITMDQWQALLDAARTGSGAVGTSDSSTPVASVP